MHALREGAFKLEESGSKHKLRPTFERVKGSPATTGLVVLGCHCCELSSLPTWLGSSSVQCPRFASAVDVDLPPRGLVGVSGRGAGMTADLTISELTLAIALKNRL